MIDSNTTELIRRWWKFVEDQDINLTDRQREVAVAYLEEKPILVMPQRGWGQTFIHNLLMDFEVSYHD